MITITYNVRKKIKNQYSSVKVITCYPSIDKARKEISLAVQEMRLAKANGTKPKKEILAVSYDTDSERRMLLEIGALESEDNYGY